MSSHIQEIPILFAIHHQTKIFDLVTLSLEANIGVVNVDRYAGKTLLLFLSQISLTWEWERSKISPNILISYVTQYT